MPIKTPGSRLYDSIGIDQIHKAVKKIGKKSGYASLNLVSMVDMLMILVVFLLQTFSASGELLFMQKNIELPKATNWVDLDRAPIIGVTNDLVTIDGRPVASTDELLADKTVDWKLGELHDQLATLKTNFELINGKEQFTGTAIVQGDRGVDFKVLKKVMYTAAVAGYRNLNFAVRPRSAAAAAPAE